MIRNPSVAAIAALLMGALANRREGECFCGHCDEGETLAQATAKALTRAKAERENLDNVIQLLENPTRDGKTLVDIQAGVLMYKDEPMFVTFAAYGTEDEDDEDYIVVFKDSRKEGEKVFHVHGHEGIAATINSIREKLHAEFIAKAEAEAATAKASAAEAETNTPNQG